MDFEAARDMEKLYAYYENVVKKIPFILFGDFFRDKADKYDSLRRQLRQARIPMGYEMYLSNAAFYSLIAGLFGALFGVIISYVVVVVVGLPEQLTKLQINPDLVWLLAYRDIFIALFILVFLTLLLGLGTYFLFLILPSLKVSERRQEIERELPYAVTFMYALSQGGMNVIDVFRALSASRETYGAAAEEVGSIVRDMEYFGMDLRNAIAEVSEITPSETFKELMYNLLTVIDSGGDITKYFQDKSEQYLQQAEIEQKGYLETLGLIAESYVTAFVAGPLFMIILGTLMTVMGSGNLMMVYAIIYAVIPIGSIMFVVMIDMMSPSASGRPPELSTQNIEQVEVEVPDDASEEEKELFKQLKKDKKSLALKKALKNPLKPVKEVPLRILIVSGPLGLVFLLFGVFTNMAYMGNLAAFSGVIDDYLVFTAIIVCAPLALFHELKVRREKRIQSQIPDFLKKIASTNETGMTLAESIELISRDSSGELSREIRKVWRDIDWGIDIGDALIRFANRIQTHLVTRAMTLLTRAVESSGSVSDILRVAARDASTYEMLKRERATNMMIYVVIIYISFLVFAGIIYVLSTTFLAEMAAAGAKTAGSGAGGFMRSFDLDMYNRIFFHAALIQGFSSGLIAGTMGEGSVLSGLKHSMIMLTIAYILFTFFI